MNRWWLVVIVLNAIWLIFEVPPVDAQERPRGGRDVDKPLFEWESLQGTWMVVGYEQDGKEHMYPEPGDYWKFGQWDARQWSRNDKESQLYPLWRNDESSKPKRLDLFTIDVGRGEVLGRTGAYELRGDTLLWTHAQGFGGVGPRARPTIDRENKITLSPRPTSLATVPRDGFVKYILKRVTDKQESLAPEERKGDNASEE
jgi:uncharacterized protein (TIGR03067 family)